VPVPLELHFIPHPAPDAVCSKCGGDAPTYSVSVFHKQEYGDSEPICLNCLSQGTAVLRVELESDEVKPDRRPDKRARKRAQRQDQHVARLTGARIQPNSGATAHEKGDLRKKGELRIETKYTGKQGFRVTRAMLDKIRGECALKEKPALVLTFVHPDTLSTQDEWVIIPVEDWNAAGDNSGPNRT